MTAKRSTAKSSASEEGITVSQLAESLIRNRNSLSGQTITILDLANRVEVFTGSARLALSNSAGAHKSLAGSEPDDAEFVAAVALIAASESFVAAAAAARPVLGAPSNWRPSGSAIDTALRELNR